MARALIRARMSKVWVVDNGDREVEVTRSRREIEAEVVRLGRELSRPGLSSVQLRRRRLEYAAAHDQLEALSDDSTLQASLHYPRSGESLLVATRSLRLGDGVGQGVDLGDDPELFASLLFKEEVQGETDLVVVIHDRDPKNPVVRFLRGLSVRLFGAAAGELKAGLTHVLTSSTATELSEYVKSAIRPGKKKERVHVIAQSARAELRLDAEGVLRVANAAPGTEIEAEGPRLTLRLRVPPGGKAGRLRPGDANGELVLLLDAEPFP